MKKLNFLRPLALLLVLALLLTASLLPASAKADPLYTHWSSDSSVSTVTAQFPDGEAKIYTPVSALSHRVRFFYDKQFRYEDSLRVGDELYTVVSPGYQSELILLDDGEYEFNGHSIHHGTVLATQKGHTRLADLEKGYLSDQYRIYASANYYAYFDESLLAALRTAPTGQSVSYTLFELKDFQRYEIFGMTPDTPWYGYLEGYVFETADGLFYASARSLPDSCFGEDAELLPKTTERLLLIPLDEELSERVYSSIARLQNHFPSYDSEEDYLNNTYDPDDAIRGITLATVIILGIVCPIAPVTLGLCLPHAKNLGRKKRWYLLTAAGGVWLAMGVLLLVLMCTVM